MSIILDLLFPIRCRGCGQNGQYLCPSCRQQVYFKSIRDGNRLSLFRYHGAIKKLITDLKFNYVSDLSTELVQFVMSGFVVKYPSLLKYWQDNNFIFIPIPLHERRQNWRSFNQSSLVGQLLAQKLNLGYNDQLLFRTKNTLPQTQIHDKIFRKKNISNSFQMINGAMINDKSNIILFDDVYTTGSTIKSAISVFPKNTNIWVLTIAG